MSPLSASGARIQGDDYQHLFIWCQTLRVLLPGSDVISIGVEDPNAGNVDDLVVYHSRERNEFYQVKFSVDARQLANTDWLISPSRTGGPSIIKRFHEFWKIMDAKGRHPKLELVTNRPSDPNDAMMVLRDGRDGTVATRLAGAAPRSYAGKLRSELTSHLKTDEAHLLEFLGDLRFRVGKLHAEWDEQAAVLMVSLGLRYGNKAIQTGVTTVRGWITAGIRRLTVQQIRHQIQSLGLQAEEPAAILLVQAIDRDAMPENATIALDWVDLYEGDEPRTRRKLLDQQLWNKRIRPEMQDAARRLRADGYRRILVRGYMRLPTWFTVGVELGKTAGFNVTSLQGNQQWESTGELSDYPLTIAMNEALGSGSDLAIGAPLSADLSPDVLSYLTSNVPRVGRYISLAPEMGPCNNALTCAPEARAWALNFRYFVRKLIPQYRPDKLHLFLAVPHGAALLLGHMWDRMLCTQLYEDQGASDNYLPSFLIPN